jgi:hypothetical protein
MVFCGKNGIIFVKSAFLEVQKAHETLIHTAE